jgi:lysophospholipase L1-like esterase
LLAALAVALVASACSGGRPKTLPASAAGRAVRYVALGGGDTLGEGTEDSLRDAWPQVLFRTALPRAATFVNFASTGATSEDVLDRQVPEALALNPDLVTISIFDDAFTDTPVTTFETRLRDIVSRFRAGRNVKVLVANIPPLDRRPGYAQCLPGATDPTKCHLSGAVPTVAQLDARVAALDAAIARVATATGATLVDVDAAMRAERAAGREASEFFSDDVSPNAAGSKVYADAFAAAYARAR